MVLWRGWCGTLKRVMWYFEDGGVVLLHQVTSFFTLIWYLFEVKFLYSNRYYFFRKCSNRFGWISSNETTNFSRRAYYVEWIHKGMLKRVVWYFEEGCVIFWRGWLWYFEEGFVALWRGRYGTFDEGCVVLWWGLCDILKRVAWYFEELIMLSVLFIIIIYNCASIS